jgi:hypothetical protein
MEHGDLVLCVCDFTKFVNQYDEEINYPKPGKYYTIRKVKNAKGLNVQILYFEEINNEIITGAYTRSEIGFKGDCFVKMPAPDISELTNLLK